MVLNSLSLYPCSRGLRYITQRAEGVLFTILPLPSSLYNATPTTRSIQREIEKRERAASPLLHPSVSGSEPSIPRIFQPNPRSGFCLLGGSSKPTCVRNLDFFLEVSQSKKKGGGVRGVLLALKEEEEG